MWHPPVVVRHCAFLSTSISDHPIPASCAKNSPPSSMESQFDLSVQVGNLPRGSACRRARFTVFQLSSSSSFDLHPSCSNSDHVVLSKSGSLGRTSCRTRRPIGRILMRAPAFHLHSCSSIYPSCFLYAQTEYNMYITPTQNQI